MSKLKEKLMLSEKGYSDLKKAITACTITNIALLLPSMVACLIFWELLKPFTGEAISWAALWKLLGLGLVAAILVFLAAKNDYRKTYIASYKEASTTRLRIAEHLRKLPMSFFNTKDLSDITTNMMADCSSMESMLSSTIPPLIANIISVTLTCVCLAFFDWRMALAIFCTMPVTFLIIWCGRKLQLRLFDKQVDVKLEASSQIQEYLEGIKIIKSCDLGGSRFDALDKALQAMRKIAIKVELASGILVQGASLILQAGLGITIFIGTVLITNGKIELLSLLVLLMFSTQIYGPILAILSQLTSLFHLETVTNRMRTLPTTPAMEGEDKDVSKYDIELKNVTFGYSRLAQPLIRDFNLSLKPGSRVAFVGPSGCGKSTTLRMIAGLEEITSGELWIDGQLCNYVEAKDRDLSMVFQNYALYPNMTVYENMAFSLKIRKQPKDEVDKKVHEAAKMLGIEHLLDRRPSALSGGQKQRVAIGSAIMRRPKAFLMDEPLSNLDAKLRAQMRVELAKLHKELKTTVIYVTHDQTEAMTLGTKIIVMKDGVVQQADTPERIYRHPANKFVAGFIGAPSMNFMETMVMERNGAVYLEADGGVTLRAKGENEMVLRRAYLGKMVILGLRPEDLQDETTASAHRICYEENQLKAFVDLREMIGAEAYLHMNTGKNLITARVPSEVPVTVKESITLYADMEKAQIFDPFTEENILSLPVEKEERATA